MATQDPWLEFESLRHNVKINKVDGLKNIINGLNEECGALMSKSGKKQELIDRIISQLDAWRSRSEIDKWTRAKAILSPNRPSGIPGSMASNALAYATIQSGQNPYGTPGSSRPINGYVTPGGSTSTNGQYDPFAPPRKVAASTSASTTTSSSPGKQGIRFKSSPFFRIDQAVSNVTECPESASATDRRSQTILFTLTNDQLNKLNSSSPKYQLRLYCTSSLYYSSGPHGFRSNTIPCPIEFPATCEVRVNNIQLTANLKGLKKKPGTAPPPDLGKAVRLVNQNRIEMVYVNSQQPVQPRKFYLAVYLVEVTTVDQLVDRLKKGKYNNSDQVLAKMVQPSSDDDDIVAGPQKMSLKCPLSYLRITTPCRSSQCVHSQCFDAMSWFSIMEQTTTWLCPVCEKPLNVDELIVDGYFDTILKQTPESVEDVMVEADGEWHTSDNKYGSAKWKAAHGPITAKPVAQRKPVPSPVKSHAQAPTLPHANGAATADVKPRTNIEVLVLDSDDEEEEGRVKRELSPSSGGSAHSLGGSQVLLSQSNASAGGMNAGRLKPRADAIIDLTLDSDNEEETPRPSPTRGQKRTAPEPDASETMSWKRPHLDSRLPSSSQLSSSGVRMNGAGTGSSMLNGFSQLNIPIRLPPMNTNPPQGSSSSARYAPGYTAPQPSYPFVPNPPSSLLSARPGSTHESQYSPMTSSTYLPRINGSSTSNWP